MAPSGFMSVRSEIPQLKADSDAQVHETGLFANLSTDSRAGFSRGETGGRPDRREPAGRVRRFQKLAAVSGVPGLLCHEYFVEAEDTHQQHK